MSESTPSEIRALFVSRLRSALKSGLASIAATPEDKLDFKPSETAKSIRELVLHITEGNGYCLDGLGAEKPSSEDWLEGLKLSTDALINAIEALTPAQLAGTVTFFGREFPIPVFLAIVEWHASRHFGQIDYIQTIYGDLDDHR